MPPPARTISELSIRVILGFSGNCIMLLFPKRYSICDTVGCSRELQQLSFQHEKGTSMSDLDLEEHPRHASPIPILAVLLTVVGLAALGGLFWSYTLSNRIAAQEKQAQALAAQNEKLNSDLDKTNARLKVESEALGQSVGITQKQFEMRAQSLLRRQEEASKQLETTTA